MFKRFSLKEISFEDMLRMSEIIAGKRIGNFELGMPYETLIKKIKEHGSIRINKTKGFSSTILTCFPYRFWIDDTSKQITQITVSSGYQGKFLDSIGIGSTLHDIKSIAGEYYEDLDVFKLKLYPGICFEVGDSGTDAFWDELSAPVEDISIYIEN